jgi:hypothetical protein
MIERLSNANLHRLFMGSLLLLSIFSAPLAFSGTIGGGNQGRCEMLESEATQVCTGKGKNRVCEVVDSFCGGAGSDGSCSCAPGCETSGNCCADFAPVCTADFDCTPDSGQIAFLHVGGMCSTQWDYPDSPDRLADVAHIDNAISLEVKAVQTDAMGTQVAAKTLGRYLDACCTDSNSCIIYNYSNGDNVVGFALDQMATTTQICTGRGKNRTCEEDLAWNILEVRTSAGNGGGSELSNWGGLADLFACDLASEIGPTQVRNLYDHNNTRGVPIYHIGGFLDQTTGSDDFTLDAAWWFLPWHNDGAVGYHSSGARNTAVEWCGDGRNLSWDWDYFGNWCTDENLCSSNYGTLFQGHSVAVCDLSMENSDHYDQKMAFILMMGQ